jgi:hypothetical protein
MTPADGHQPCCLLYHVFSLSLRDIELPLADRRTRRSSQLGWPIYRCFLIPMTCPHYLITPNSRGSNHAPPG